MKKNKKVLLGMSGGVDSSTAAYLLQKDGYDVIGVTMKLWNETENDDGCCALSAVQDAKRVADKIAIPFYVLNMKDDFKKYVVEYFLKEYNSGRTPNPCVACNRYIKFGALLDKAKGMDIDYVATGHYANIVKKQGRYFLTKAKDQTKDQTYFLYNLTQDQLSKTLFPLGKYSKKEIRNIAKKIGLKVADKPDSQEICFVQDNNHYEFVKKHSKEKMQKGEIMDTDGKLLGFHSGIAKYTIGQRKGIGISFGKPMYVVDIDADKNRVILGNENILFQKQLIAKDLNWISIKLLDKEMEVKAKIRYQAKAQSARLIPLEQGSVKVVFRKKQRAITKGQSVVFYKGKYVVGGGIIER